MTDNNPILTWALVQNTIVIDLVPATAQDAQDPQFLWFDVTNIVPQPGIGWSTPDSGKTWVNPNKPRQQTPQQYIAGVIASAADFGAQIASEFAAENVLMGLTEDQMDQCLTTLAPVLQAIQAGSLKIAIIRMNKIVPDGVVLTSDRIKKYRNQIEDYLGVPET